MNSSSNPVSIKAFAKDQQAMDAVIRTIEIPGEAANNIGRSGANLITRHPDFLEADAPMRNKMIQDYFTTDPPVVWQSVKTDLPGAVRLVCRPAEHLTLLPVYKVTRSGGGLLIHPLRT